MGQVGSVISSEEGEKRRFFSNKALFALFLPLIIEQLLAFLIGMADSLMAAFISEAAVSGVSLVDVVMALLISLFAALSTGGAVIAAQYIGRERLPKAQDASNQLIWFIGIVALIVMVLVYCIKPFLLHTVFGQIDDDVRSHANIYLNVVTFSIPFLALYQAGASLFRAMGNAKLPMLVALLASVTNIIGNYLSVFVFEIGTLGIALSTLLAHMIAATTILLLALNRDLPLHVNKTLHHKFHWIMVRRMMRIGIPYGLENGLFQLGRVIVLSIVATMGTTAIAANAVAGSITLFEVLPGMGIGLGLTVVVARCVGAGDYEQARYYAKKVIAMIYVAHIIMGGLIVLLLPRIMSIYHLSEVATDLTMQLVLWHTVFAIFIWPLGNTMPVIFRASGDAKYPMYVAVLSMFICRVALAWLLGNYMGIGVVGAWFAMFLDWIVKSILFIRRYRSGVWTTFRAI